MHVGFVVLKKGGAFRRVIIAEQAVFDKMGELLDGAVNDWGIGQAERCSLIRLEQVALLEDEPENVLTKTLLLLSLVQDIPVMSVASLRGV